VVLGTALLTQTVRVKLILEDDTVELREFHVNDIRYPEEQKK
jgi:hypothetical protein